MGLCCCLESSKGGKYTDKSLETESPTPLRLHSGGKSTKKSDFPYIQESSQKINEIDEEEIDSIIGDVRLFVGC